MDFVYTCVFVQSFLLSPPFWFSQPFFLLKVYFKYLSINVRVCAVYVCHIICTMDGKTTYLCKTLKLFTGNNYYCSRFLPTSGARH